MSISQEVKDSVKFKLKEGAVFTTEARITDVHITQDDSNFDGTVRVHIGELPEMNDGKGLGNWVEADDCDQLAVFFKKLAKKLRLKAGA